MNVASQLAAFFWRQTLRALRIGGVSRIAPLKLHRDFALKIRRLLRKTLSTLVVPNKTPLRHRLRRRSQQGQEQNHWRYDIEYALTHPFHRNH
ncbi:hypothetical protein JZU56_05045, partial [bacterium]|nr:hypothetical protein [bacterium]